MTPEEFKQIKGTPESIPWSVLGLGRNLVKGGRADYINRVKRLGQLKGQADKVSNSFEDYRNVEIRPGDVVYADIPYENTDTYNYGKGRKFDKKAFCDWAQAQDFPVFVSESVMPEGWVEIASESMKTINPKKNRVEKLWVQEKFADQYKKDDGIRFSTSRRGKKENQQQEIAVPGAETPFKATVISSADGAKVLQNLETLARIQKI